MPPPVPSNQQPAAPSTASCPPIEGDAEAAYAAYRAHEDAPDTDEHERWKPRYELALRAAKAGHPDGQAHAGGLLFSHHFQVEAPDETSADDRTAYVEALTWLFLGTLRGSEYGMTYAPGMDVIGTTAALPAELETPLADVPREWLDASLAAAKQLVPCYER